MAIRDLLKARPEDVEVKKENDSLLCIYDDGRKKYIPAPVIKDGKVYRKQRVGRGKATEKGGMFGGEGDTWTEYERYEDVLIPVMNGTVVPHDIQKRIQEDDEFTQQYIREHPESVLSLGENPGGKKIVWKSELEADKRLNELQYQYDNLHIDVERSQGNLMPHGRHLVLSCRVPREVWEQVKHCFRYFDSSKFNDEVWGDVFKGYEILPDKIQEVEDILEIPENLRFERLQEEEEERKAENRAEGDWSKGFLEELKAEFSGDNALQDDGDDIVLEGEEIPFRNMEGRIYGGGEWFVVQDDYIWRVTNNGMDGDDWSLNNIRTGGAGAIGTKFKKTARRMELLRKLKKERADVVEVKPSYTWLERPEGSF